MVKKMILASSIVLLTWGSNRTISSQKMHAIVVTIEEISSDEKAAHFDSGEALRGKMRFRDAIREYRKVITPGEPCGKESEAHYNIGLCYTWLGKLDSAAVIFEEVINTYPDDGRAMGWARYGLAWVDAQKGNYDQAINLLQETLDSQVCPDRELNALILFQIGRIHLSYLNDLSKAREIFQRVLKEYPGTKITDHPFLEGLKKEMS